MLVFNMYANKNPYHCFTKITETSCGFTTCLVPLPTMWEFAKNFQIQLRWCFKLISICSSATVWCNVANTAKVNQLKPQNIIFYSRSHLFMLENMYLHNTCNSRRSTGWAFPPFNFAVERRPRCPNRLIPITNLGCCCYCADLKCVVVSRCRW